MELPPLPVPTELPMIGAAGTNAYGYPRRTADRVGFLTLLRNRRFDELDRYVHELQARFEADFRQERIIGDALGAFQIRDPRIKPLLDEWVARRPESFAPYVARAGFYHEQAWKHRTEEAVRDVSPAQLEAMHAMLVQTRADLARAIELEPNCMECILLLSATDRVEGRTAAQAGHFDAATRICVSCVTPYELHMGNLAPRWGGSYEAMDALAARALERVDENPALRTIGASPDIDRCKTQLQNPSAALPVCQRALTFGSRPSSHDAMARVLSQLGDIEGALREIDAALLDRPDSASYLERRHDLLRRAQRQEEADEVGRRLAHLDPGSEIALRLVRRLGLSVGASGP